jgi:hypothetical protein
MAMGSSPDSFQALAHATIFLAGMLHTLKLQFCCRIRRLQAHLISAPGHIAGKGQSYSSPKNGLSEANHLTTVGSQSQAMVWQNCHTLRPRLEKCIAIGGAYSN